MNSKQRLIASVQKLLWERGYIGTSPNAVLNDSKIGHGSLYHHFSGKADLALAAIEGLADNLLQVSQVELSKPGTAIDKIRALLKRERDILKGCPIGRLTLDPEVFNNDTLRQPLQIAFEKMRNRILDVLKDGLDKGEVDKETNISAIADLILASVQGGYVLARAAKSETPFNHAIDALLDLLQCTVCRH